MLSQRPCFPVLPHWEGDGNQSFRCTEWCDSKMYEEELKVRKSRKTKKAQAHINSKCKAMVRAHINSNCKALRCVLFVQF